MQLCEASGSSLGYGFSRVMSKPRPQSQVSDADHDEVSEGALAIWWMMIEDRSTRYTKVFERCITGNYQLILDNWIL